MSLYRRYGQAFLLHQACQPPGTSALSNPCAAHIGGDILFPVTFFRHVFENVRGLWGPCHAPRHNRTYGPRKEPPFNADSRVEDVSFPSLSCFSTDNLFFRVNAPVGAAIRTPLYRSNAANAQRGQQRGGHDQAFHNDSTAVRVYIIGRRHTRCRPREERQAAPCACWWR